MAQALMILGTGSHVGKSLLTAAFCRIFVQDGYRVAPFKAQNMALNSAATPEGLEIGRAQAMQAEAAGLAPHVDMNPVLLKPATDTRSQVVVLGKVWRQLSAGDYHRHRVRDLLPQVVESYRRLAARYDVVVLEGAGSCAEINLRDGDIVNLAMAEAADASCLLVGDIDRGGVFASLFGTLELLPEDERRRIRGYLINKFRGDLSLLQPGIDLMAARIEPPCLGVIPYLPAVGLDEEDGVAMEERRTVARVWTRGQGSGRALRVGVLALPHLANFTDFDPLAAEPCVELAYVEGAADLEWADLVILPGSKETLYDLAWLRREGFDDAVATHVRRGGLVVGVCGGLQILGREITDPAGMEGGGRARGLGLLALDTELAVEKVTLPARGELLGDRLFGQEVGRLAVQGYEIHLGVTRYDEQTPPLFSLTRRGSQTPERDGAGSEDGHIVASYLHGLFDSDAFRHAFLRAARTARGLDPPATLVPYTAQRQGRFDRLARHVREAVDLEPIRRWLEGSRRAEG